MAAMVVGIGVVSGLRQGGCKAFVAGGMFGKAMGYLDDALGSLGALGF